MVDIIRGLCIVSAPHILMIRRCGLTESEQMFTSWSAYEFRIAALIKCITLTPLHVGGTASKIIYSAHLGIALSARVFHHSYTPISYTLIYS